MFWNKTTLFQILHLGKRICHLPIYLSALELLFSPCVCHREWCLSKAVIWHVSECVWANQTEGTL